MVLILKGLVLMMLGCLSVLEVLTFIHMLLKGINDHYSKLAQ